MDIGLQKASIHATVFRIVLCRQWTKEIGFDRKAEAHVFDFVQHVLADGHYVIVFVKIYVSLSSIADAGDFDYIGVTVVRLKGQAMQARHAAFIKLNRLAHQIPECHAHFIPFGREAFQRDAAPPCES